MAQSGTSDAVADFEHLVPEVMLNAVEQATGMKMSGVAVSLPSYINRVYETQAVSGERLIAKFYRPGRWSRQALQDEHDFVADCMDDEIPVIAPVSYPGRGTIHESNGVYFTIFPKRYGRALEINCDDDWVRVGGLLGRVHLAGSRHKAANRTDLHPGVSTVSQVRGLLDGGFVSSRHRQAFADVTSRMLDVITGLFGDIEFIRIHGDCHGGNLLDRPGEGTMIIDFDDMMMGPPVHDLWLLLPDRADRCRRELELLLRGYEQFREFDDFTLRLIEPLRAMRIIYYLSWCSRQVNDYRFRATHPEWGTDAFWLREVNDLVAQLGVISEHL